MSADRRRRAIGSLSLAAIGATGCSLLLDTGGLEGEDASGADAAAADAPADGLAPDPGDAAPPGEAGPGTDAAADATVSPPCPIDSTLRLCLRFEGAVVDESSYAVPPLATENIGFVPGPRGLAASFRLTPASKLTFSNVYFSAVRTIELWVRPIALARMILVDVLDDFAIILESDGTIRCRQPELTSTMTVKLDEWSHVACTLDGITLRAYVNGTPAGTLASTNEADNNGYTAIGENSPDSNNRFEGFIDEVRLWTSTRTGAQIAEAAKR